MTPDKYLLKDILLTLQAIRDFNAERSDEIIGLLRQSNKEAYSQTAALQYLVQEAKEMEDK
tara:strand:+ start:151 stop:333 length:183 start_codon:yes stop_codon:yes gene_type:complete